MSNLVIYRPVKSNRKGQSFGENRAMCKLDAEGKAIRPFIVKGIPNTGIIPEGWISFYKELGMLGHSGEDWTTWHGEPLYFPVDCEQAGGWHSVEASDLDGGLGVDVVSNDPILIDGVTSHIKIRFWHLKSAWKDTDVKFGELIGFCNDTGASGGDHLHWGLKLCDEHGRATYSNNGYYGAIDFSEWYSNYFVLDVIDLQTQALTAIQLAYKVIANVKLFLSKR